MDDSTFAVDAKTPHAQPGGNKLSVHFAAIIDGCLAFIASSMYNLLKMVDCDEPVDVCYNQECIPQWHGSDELCSVQ